MIESERPNSHLKQHNIFRGILKSDMLYLKNKTILL